MVSAINKVLTARRGGDRKKVQIFPYSPPPPSLPLSLSLSPPSAAGLFHSQENKGFVGVVRPLLPVPTPATNDRMRVWDPRAGTGARPLQRMKPPCPLRGSGKCKHKSQNIKTFLRVGQKDLKKISVMIRAICVLGITQVNGLQITSSKFGKIDNP